VSFFISRDVLKYLLSRGIFFVTGTQSRVCQSRVFFTNATFVANELLHGFRQGHSLLHAILEVPRELKRIGEDRAQYFLAVGDCRGIRLIKQSREVLEDLLCPFVSWSMTFNRSWILTMTVL